MLRGTKGDPGTAHSPTGVAWRELSVGSQRLFTKTQIAESPSVRWHDSIPEGCAKHSDAPHLSRTISVHSKPHLTGEASEPPKSYFHDAGSRGAGHCYRNGGSETMVKLAATAVKGDGSSTLESLTQNDNPAPARALERRQGRVGSQPGIQKKKKTPQLALHAGSVPVRRTRLPRKYDHSVCW